MDRTYFMHLKGGNVQIEESTQFDKQNRDVGVQNIHLANFGIAIYRFRFARTD